jgi:DNA-binding GntR family transcriptional regulator
MPTGPASSTLREIFNGLASEGLITAEGARGFEVASISRENLREVRAMRQLLECDALRSSFEARRRRVGGARGRRAPQARDRSKSASAPAIDRRGGAARYDWEFHNALISACGSRLLLEMHAGIYDKYLRYLMLASVFRGEPVVEEHRKLLNFALERDWRSAQATTITHIEDCVAQMVSGDWW